MAGIQSRYGLGKQDWGRVGHRAQGMVGVIILQSFKITSHDIIEAKFHKRCRTIPQAIQGSNLDRAPTMPHVRTMPQVFQSCVPTVYQPHVLLPFRDAFLN